MSDLDDDAKLRLAGDKARLEEMAGTYKCLSPLSKYSAYFINYLAEQLEYIELLLSGLDSGPEGAKRSLEPHTAFYACGRSQYLLTLLPLATKDAAADTIIG